MLCCTCDSQATLQKLEKTCVRLEKLGHDISWIGSLSATSHVVHHSKPGSHPDSSQASSLRGMLLQCFLLCLWWTEWGKETQTTQQNIANKARHECIVLPLTDIVGDGGVGVGVGVSA